MTADKGDPKPRPPSRSFAIEYTVHRVLARHNKGECCDECPGGRCFGVRPHHWRLHEGRVLLGTLAQEVTDGR
jgi:hypothetical protein